MQASLCGAKGDSARTEISSEVSIKLAHQRTLAQAPELSDLNHVAST
jgi:hypothetical protein